MKRTRSARVLTTPGPAALAPLPIPEIAARNPLNPIKLFIEPTAAIIEYNVLTGYDHIGILAYGMEDSLVQYNRCEQGPAVAEDYCINLAFGSHNNTVRYNYSQDAGYGVAIGRWLDE